MNLFTNILILVVGIAAITVLVNLLPIDLATRCSLCSLLGMPLGAYVVIRHLEGRDR